MRIRYFAAAAHAAGTTEEHLDLEELATDGAPVSLEAVLDMLSLREPPAEPVASGILVRRSTSLGTVLGRCSFLVNGISVQDRKRVLESNDELDVLPPFAGG